MSDKNITISQSKENFYTQIKTILQSARDRAYTQVNFIMVEAYWHIGQQIVEEEQRGEDKSQYGSSLIKELFHKLTVEFGKGFSKRNLHHMVRFYLSFPNVQTLSTQLTWSYMGDLKKVFTLDDVNTHKGYFGLQREIYR